MRTSIFKQKASVIFIFGTVLLDMLALGVIIPVLPPLIEEFLGGDTAKAAEMIGIFGTAWAAMQFIFSPILGVLSDKIGRRPVVLISNFGLGIDYLLMAVAPTLGWLFVGRVISGITAASISAASSYIADVTSPEKRPAAFGMLGMAFGAGFILGPAIGGFFGEIHPRLPFAVAGALSLLNGLYGLFILPESLAPENRRDFSWSRANPLGSITLLRSTKKLYALAEVTFLTCVTHVVFPTSMVIYMNYRYGWTTRTVGIMMAVVGITNGFVQGALVGPLVKRWGERKALIYGLLFGVVGFLIAGLSSEGFYFWFSIPFLALWGVANAVVNGMMTSEVGPDQQGHLQGAIGALRGIGELIGPGLFSYTFAYFIQPNSFMRIPGSPFFLAAFLLFLSVLAFSRRRPA